MILKFLICASWWMLYVVILLDHTLKSLVCLLFTARLPPPHPLPALLEQKLLKQTVWGS